MRYFRKFLAVLLALLLLAWIPAGAAASEGTEAYVQRMLQYYLRFGEDADTEIGALLDYLSEIDPRQGELWRRIMVSWAYHNSQMTLNQGILPDGLPQDDSLCIVILGYGLNRDGSMQEELIDRLVVGLSSALKYPNAYVAVTGGATSSMKGVTEAGQMAQWLLERGVSEDRLILETKALSTLQNAKNVCALLASDYPQVTRVALVTSDYHIRQSCTFFATAAHYAVYASHARPLNLVSNAVNTTDRHVSDLYTQAWGICAITGIPFDPKTETQPELSE